MGERLSRRIEALAGQSQAAFSGTKSVSKMYGGGENATSCLI
jgi:hypothetical protein